MKEETLKDNMMQKGTIKDNSHNTAKRYGLMDNDQVVIVQISVLVLFK